MTKQSRGKCWGKEMRRQSIEGRPGAGKRTRDASQAGNNLVVWEDPSIPC